MHSFLKISGIYPFLYAKVTHTHSTPLFSHNFILLNAPHACSHLLFPEPITFHSPTEHKNGTNLFHILAQTEYKNGTNPFFWNETMTLHSTWFSNRTHPVCRERWVYVLKGKAGETRCIIHMGKCGRL
jgi:hypothetical protein